MIKNMRLSKRLLANIVVVGLVGGSILGYKVYRRNEVKRVKEYLEDFLTEDNYVDLSKIDNSYDIGGFRGEDLKVALEEMDVLYVRIMDAYIFDGSHVTGFRQKNAVNRDIEYGIDNNGDIQYAMYEPIRECGEYGVVYRVPEGYELEDIVVEAEPIRYDDLKGRDIIRIDNNYEDSYSLVLINGRNR